MKNPFKNHPALGEKWFESRESKKIEVDGKPVWLSRAPAVVAMVTVELSLFNKYVLICKRGKGAADNIGKWCLPCGYLDWDENGVEAAMREVWEETGVFLPVMNFPKPTQPIFINTNPESSNNQNVSLYYKFDGKMHPDDFEFFKETLTTKYGTKDEVEEIRFIKPNEIEEYDFCFNHETRIAEFFNK